MTNLSNSRYIVWNAVFEQKCKSFYDPDSLGFALVFTILEYFHTFVTLLYIFVKLF